MAVHRPLHPACERARAWVSQELDDDLSPLELAALSAHLVGCPDCEAFAQGLRTVTGELRSAPLLVPERTVELPRRDRPGRLVLGGSAAAVAAALLVGAFVGSLTRGGPTPVQLRPTAAGIAATQQPYLEQSLLAMLQHLKHPTGRTLPV
jgi:predicted anti-sigma-YlaC factor YlaD